MGFMRLFTVDNLHFSFIFMKFLHMYNFFMFKLRINSIYIVSHWNQLISWCKSTNVLITSCTCIQNFVILFSCCSKSRATAEFLWHSLYVWEENPCFVTRGQCGSSEGDPSRINQCGNRVRDLYESNAGLSLVPMSSHDHVLRVFKNVTQSSRLLSHL